ncbi:MAG: hypothetical protein HOK41_10475 [Nitrospina sp.]|jgi:hypothetical protein|nr:hypothetical protein [Nitrospina sp.]MBT6717107.1 hypothetical protein [Nitrospina sp.]
MTEKNIPNAKDLTATQHFPIEWIKTNPRKVEEILSTLPLEEQAKRVLNLPPVFQRELLVLCEDAVAVTQSLPTEEVYNLIKELGDEDSLLILSMVSAEQLQYFFDLEWWQGDKFQPERAMHWLELLDQCDDPETLEWFLSEDLDQKVMLLQSLIKVFKQDEMTDSYDGVEGLEHFTPDGVYDVFFKVKESKVIKKLFLLLAEKDIGLLHELLEAVIWFPLTITVEKSYQWRLTRTAERGIPEFEEAIGIYSSLNPDALKQEVPSSDNFPGGRFRFSPQYPLTQALLSHFFGQCILNIESEERLDAIRWELVCLANKVMVADKCDPSDLEARKKAMRKAVGYINIGLELGASGDQEKGHSLLHQLWMQSLFQVGFEQLKQVRSKVSLLLKENGIFMESIVSEGDKEKLGALVLPFPQIAEKGEEGGPVLWRDPETLDDVRAINKFLDRWAFYIRFAKQGLGLDAKILESKWGGFDYPESSKLEFLTLITTAFARHTLFKTLSCEPLPITAAKSFLDVVFLAGIFQDEGKICDEDKVSSFERALLDTPMAWTETDRELLRELLVQCVANLEEQFGRLDFSKSIQWQFTHGLLITRSL